MNWWSRGSYINNVDILKSRSCQYPWTIFSRSVAYMDKFCPIIFELMRGFSHCASGIWLIVCRERPITQLRLSRSIFCHRRAIALIFAWDETMSNKCDSLKNAIIIGKKANRIFSQEKNVIPQLRTLEFSSSKSKTRNSWTWKLSMDWPWRVDHL